MKEKFCILIQTSLKFVREVAINDMPLLFEKMIWRRKNYKKTLFEPTLA